MKLKNILILFLLVSFKFTPIFGAETLSLVHIQSNNANSVLAKVGDQITLTFTSSGPITGVSVTIAGNTITGGNLSNTGNDWTAIYTMTSGDSDGSVGFTINYTEKVSEVNTTTDGSVVTFDQIAPTITSINRVSSSPTNASSVDFTVTFSESVNNVLTSNFGLNGTATGASISGISGSGTTRTVSVTTGAVDGTIRLDLTSTTGITDGAGNALSGTHTGDQSYDVDVTAPSVTSINRVSSSPTNASSVDFTVTFSESVDNVLTSNFGLNGTATGASISGISGSGATWTVSVTTGAVDGTIRLDLTTAAGIADGVGNTLSGTHTGDQTYTIDKMAPSVSTINRASSSPTNASSVSFTITFSESVSNVLTGNFTLSGTATGASISGISGSGATWTVSVTTGAVDGTIRLDLTTAAGITDGVGNTLSGTHTGDQTYDVDVTAPSVTSINRASSTPTNASSVSFTVTFSESVNNVLTSNFGLNGTATGASISGISGSGTTRTVTVTTCAVDGTIRLDLTSVTGITDAVGNVLSITHTGDQLYAIDKNTQIPTLTLPAANGASSKPISVSFDLPEGALAHSVNLTFHCTSHTSYADRVVTFTFNSFGLHTLTLNGDMLEYNQDNTTLNPDVYSVTAGSEGKKLFDGQTYDVYLTYQDALGNTAVSSTTNSGFRYETSPPVPSFVAVTTPRNTAVSSITLTFNKNVSNVDVADFKLEKDGSNITLTGVGVTPSSGEASSFTIADLSTLTNVSGSYTFTLVAAGSGIVDHWNNPLTSDATVSWVMETTPPTLTSVTMASNNANTAYAKTGNIVTLTIVSNESLSSVSGTIGTKAAIASGSGTNWTLSRTTDGTEPEGALNFTINYSDLAGNAGTQVVTLTSGSKVIFDKTNPTLSTVTMASNNANTAYAKTGNTVTLTITASESLSALSGTIDGKTATASGSGTNWTLSRVTDGTETEGLLNFSINYSDLAGNAVTGANTLTSGTKVTFDKTAPGLNTVTMASNNTNTLYATTGNIVTLTITASENLSTLLGTIDGKTAIASGSGTSWTLSRTMDGTETEGLLNFSITPVDIAGNPSSSAITTLSSGSKVIFDKTSPTLTYVNISSNNSNTDMVCVGGKVMVSFASSETLLSSGFTVTIANQPVTLVGSGANWTASYIMKSTDTEGPVTFLIKYKDLAGNLGADVGSVTNGSSVTFDKTSPNVSGVTFLSNNSISNQKAKVGDKINVSYSETEAVTDVAIKINGKSITPTLSGSTWTGEYTMLSSDAEGALYITFECKDLAGNLSQTSNSSIIFDKTPPTFTAISIASNNSTNTTYAKLNDNVIVTFTTSETCGTPSATINGNSATIASVGGNTWTATRKIDASDNEVAVIFNISIVDAYGNAGVAGTTTTNGTSVIVDKTAPTISTVIVPSGSYGIGSVIVVNVNADASGYSGQTVKVNDEDCSLIYSSGNAYKIYYNVLYNSINRDKVPKLPINLILKDNAGNLSTEVIEATVQGGTLTINTKPTYHITGTASRCTSSATVPVTFTFTGYPPFDFSYTDSINAGSVPISGWMSNTYVVNATEGTFRIASLSDNSTNYATILTTEKAIVTENQLPVITFSPASLAYNNTDPEVNLMTFVSPIGGHFTGEGVSTSNYFYPSLATAGVKAITYTYTNSTTGCTNTKVLNITITNNSEHLDGISAIYCKDNNASTSVIITAAGITATTKDEFFTLTPASSKANTIDKTHFNLNLKEMKAGNYNLTYTYTNSDNGITSTFGSDFVIDSIGALLDFKTLDTSYCNGAGEVVLVGENIYPTQGTGHFTGPATGFFTQSGSNSATFSPSIAPKDQKISISYYYESLSGCRSATITKDTKVHTFAAASFTTLKVNYNFVETPIVLVGTPTSSLSSFQGALIEGASTLNPSKADASNIGLPIKITYTFVDSITGCSSIKEQTTTVYKASELIKVVKADNSLVNLDGTYCYADTVFNISCIPVVGGTPYKGIFSSTKGAINQTTTPSNTATFDIAKAVKINLVDTIRFKYTVGPTDYEIEKVVVIDSVGPVALNIKDNYCKYEEPLTIVGDHRTIPGINTYTFTGNAGAFSSNAIFATFSPKLADEGTWNITYKFTTTSEKQCSNSVTKTIYVNPISTVDFKLNEDCPGINKQIKLVNKSIVPVGSTMTWTWTWEGGGSSASDTAVVTYVATGLKTITLSAKTDKNCTTNKSSQITIGLGAKADFKWSNDCLSSDSVKFTNLSSGGTLDSVRWELNGVYNKGNLDSTKCLFSNTGSNTMKLWVQTIEGCKDEITKQIVIQPFYSINSFYLDSLDATKKEWNAKGIEEGGYSSWIYGLPTGDIFNKAASGKTSWYTNVGLSNQHIENSQVISPCFDLSHLKKPMIKLNIWSAPEAGRDGAVMEYSTDGGQTWPVANVLGEPDKGINWYDPGNLSSQPAGQSLGWSSSDAVTSWKSARYILDTIKNRSNVRFRIVYATKADNNKKFNGFAFDDVWIGERQQMVLNEVFTNVSDGCDAGNAYLKNYEKKRKDDVIPIHYHTSNPSGDPFYSYYNSGPLSRGFFYGASAAIPYVFLNGSELSTIVTSDEKDEFEENVIEKTLTDPFITISNMSATQGNLSISLTANKDLSGENLVLFCALVKDTINIGSDYYYNVLRRFYPNPGGTLLSNSTWLQGQTINQTIPISFDNSGEILKARIVVFVQNVSTNKIYQAASFYDLQTILSNQQIDISNLVDVYPNPARDYLIVECQSIIDKLMIFDMTGRVVGNYTPAQEKYTIPVNNMQNGIYIIKGSTKKGQFIRKFIKQ